MYDRVAKFSQLSFHRENLAQKLLVREQGFWSIREDELADSSQTARPKQDATEYEETRKLETYIDEYFKFRIDYYPEFTVHEPYLRPWAWLYYADVNDDMTERKFQVDQDIRAYITAFRFSLQRNRYRIIVLKRILQSIALLLAFTPLGLLVAFNSTFSHEVATGIAAICWLASWCCVWFQSHVIEPRVKTVIRAAAKVLSNKIQGRVNKLMQNFTEFVANIDREEASEDIGEAEWTRRSAWWMKLAMWTPKRIEYVEKFLQSEMQRTKTFMITSSAMGHGLGYAMPTAMLLMVLFVLPHFAQNSMVGISFLTLEPFYAGVVLSLLISHYSMSSTVSLAHLEESLGREPLGRNARFADIELHNKLSDQIRRDKEKLRQYKLAGGYGDAKKWGSKSLGDEEALQP